MPEQLTEDAEMPAYEVVAIMRALDEACVRAYIGGGWGADALVGEQTRPHADLDLAFDAPLQEQAIRALVPRGYRIALDQRPVRFVMRDGTGRAIDLHPVSFDASGAGIQAGLDGAVFVYPPDAFDSGTIAGREVLCLSPELQVRFHSGYPTTDKDQHDMRVLRERLGVAVPDELM